MKTCKQCGRTLDDACFRKTKSRSKGIYKNLSQGTKTICKDCESINIRAHNALKSGDEVAVAKFRNYYERLALLGHPPVTAAAKRILGIDVEEGPANGRIRENSLFETIVGQSAELLEHARKVRERSYASVDEADQVHRRLEQQLRDADLYEEITNLLDDWYMDE